MQNDTCREAREKLAGGNVSEALAPGALAERSQRAAWQYCEKRPGCGCPAILREITQGKTHYARRAKYVR